MLDAGRVRRFLWRGGVVLALLLGSALLVSETTGAGRRLWYPWFVSMAGARTHDDVLRSLGSRIRPGLEAAARERGIRYPPSALTLVGLKQERRLEVYAPRGKEHVLLRDYAIQAASGGPGPKLRQGDLQVPEGVYRLTNFNPNSSYHLSVRVDYPNERDRATARAEKRSDLGGDIYIHGKSVSIGCLALGDAAIEELYVLLADVGLRNARIVLVPSASPVPPPGAPGWVPLLYDDLRRELALVRRPPTP
jgi:hypothetical protein